MQIEREGSDITLVSFSKMVGFCLKAAEELEKDGISAEVRLLSTSVGFSLFCKSVVGSVCESNWLSVLGVGLTASSRGP